MPVYSDIIVGKSTQELEAASTIHSGEQRENECMLCSHTIFSTITQSRIHSIGNCPTHSGLSLLTSTKAIKKPLTVLPTGQLDLDNSMTLSCQVIPDSVRLTIKTNNHNDIFDLLKF